MDWMRIKWSFWEASRVAVDKLKLIGVQMEKSTDGQLMVLRMGGSGASGAAREMSACSWSTVLVTLLL